MKKILNIMVLFCVFTNTIGLTISMAINNTEIKDSENIIEEESNDVSEDTKVEENNEEEEEKKEEDKDNLTSNDSESNLEAEIENVEEEEDDDDDENMTRGTYANVASDSDTQFIEDGYYQIATALDNNKVLDISAASKDNEANVQIWNNVQQRQQKFKVEYVGNGSYTILNCRSAKALDVAGAGQKPETNVWQYEYNGTDAQKWVLEKVPGESDYYYIRSVCNDLYLDVSCASSNNGTNIKVYTKSQNQAQKFKFIKTKSIMGEKTLEEGYYTINTGVSNNKVLDISAASKQSKANVQIWNNVNVKQQMFKITYVGSGYYTIMNLNSKKYLDVDGARKTNCTNVSQYDQNYTEAQNWIIKKDENANGYYNIISECNELCLDVDGGGTANGTNVQVYEANGTKAQMFSFTKLDIIEGTKTIENGTYKISMYKNSNQVLDIDAGSTANGANVQIWSYAKVLQQKFKVQYVGDGYYTIQSVKSGKYLDVCGGNGYNGVNVWQYDYNGTDAQKWIISKRSDGSYNIISACNYLCLDVCGGYTNNGTNVQIYERTGGDAQKFYFESVKVIQLTSGTYGSSGLKIKGDSRGQNLKYYKIGNGSNVFFACFAIHGWEDLYSYDGQALVKIAEDFKNRLIEMQDEDLADKWTIYILPTLNPDGTYYGYTHNGPGRTTLYSAAPGNKGIDMNRCWSVGFTKQTSNRNYNGTEAFQAYEARSLRDFLLSKKARKWANNFSGFTWLA